jgi:hypothetical protein
LAICSTNSGVQGAAGYAGTMQLSKGHKESDCYVLNLWTP